MILETKVKVNIYSEKQLKEFRFSSIYNIKYNKNKTSYAYIS